jgi:glycosyltransferase involved in cell wall biosynthesis
MKPTISIITICFNNLDELIETCRSVDSQSMLPDEHIIVDGSTNEEIVHWLLHHPQPSYRRWIHESDKGISDAFNKGIISAKGTITHLLNSGDKYAETRAIEYALNCFEEDGVLMWVHSRYIQRRGGIDIISGVPFEKNKLWKGMRTVAHPAMFIKKALYEKIGLYNTQLRIAMDYDMLVRIRNEKFRFVPIPLVYFSPGGASHVQFAKGLDEVKKIHRQHIGYSFKQSLWQFRQKLLRLFMQTWIGAKWFQWKNRKNKQTANVFETS